MSRPITKNLQGVIQILTSSVNPLDCFNGLNCVCPGGPANMESGIEHDVVDRNDIGMLRRQSCPICIISCNLLHFLQLNKQICLFLLSKTDHHLTRESKVAMTGFGRADETVLSINHVQITRRPTRQSG